MLLPICQCGGANQNDEDAEKDDNGDADDDEVDGAEGVARHKWLRLRWSILRLPSPNIGSKTAYACQLIR